ncbi:ribosome maturation factor RimM [Neogemmobacter tilapiae]|uniref:Ribosome maturation factor RimM n=1 Tax=Neogemmobacter tilapiae TaxID=875041 RepID=A0A918TWA4_9RHOB|nr:ribosome maturation factor RimM [Gemmobacter tilapiae]GHC63229.1 ribosome maturation factor RimM [Gemmobacter tilapiae]
MTDRILVGAVSGAFGVQGEVRLKSFCADPEDIASYGPLFTEDGSRSFKIRLTKAVSGGFGARLTGVETRDQAEAMRGLSLYADRSRLPRLPDDEFYHNDLIGLMAQDTGGAAMGQVIAVQNHGAGDILEIRPLKGGETLLVPFTLANVPTVDLTKAVIVVDLPETLD